MEGAVAGVFIGFLLFGVLLGLVAGRIWENKGGGFAIGFVLGFFLGIIGLILVAVLSPSSITGQGITCPYCAERVRPNARVCKHCGRELPLRSCPHCGAETIATSSTCPNCRKTSDAWKLHEGHWWKRENGEIYRYNPTTQIWETQS